MTNALIGGFLIGIAAVWLYLALGRIAGISGIAAQVLAAPGSARWPLAFVVGLGAGGWFAHALTGLQPSGSLADQSLALLCSAGLFVGFGTRLGSGCTSGHGVCGVSRLSPRSIVATAVFLLVGIVTATTVAS